MLPRMSSRERDLFESFLSRSHDYLEFGAGGSTVLASQLVSGSIISIDSSQEWIDAVKTECQARGSVQPTTHFVDIGPTGSWGTPTDHTTRSRWPNYHSEPWQYPNIKDADLCLVDGRFRVACFLQALLNCKPDTIIMFHDFRSRKHYHVIENVARLIAEAEDLSVFIPIIGTRVTSRRLLRDYSYIPD